MIWPKEQFLGSGLVLPRGCGCSPALCLNLSLLPNSDLVLDFGIGKKGAGQLQEVPKVASIRQICIYDTLIYAFGH